MKILSDFQHFHMKADTSSERTWITFDAEEISNKFAFFGKHSWTPKNIMLPHIHTAYELQYFVGGEGAIFSRGIEYKLSRGDILVMEPNTEHEGIAHPENPFELFFMGYDFNPHKMVQDPAMFGVDQLFLGFYEAYKSKMQLPIIRDRHGIGQVLFKLIHEINDTQLCRKELIRAYLLEIFILMIRNLAEFIDKREVSLHGRKSVEKAKEFIKTHFHGPLTLEEISGYVCLSPSHFCRLFKNATTLTPIEYLNAVRIENAKKFLIYSDLTLTEISSRVGFSSIHYFSHYFKKKEGICPLDYRRDKKRLLFP